MAGVRINFTEMLDLTAVNNYENEIKKSIYSDNIDHQFKLTSQILKNVMPLFNQEGLVSTLYFEGLDKKTKAKLAHIFLDHAKNARILSWHDTDFIIVTEIELDAYFDTAINLCTTADDRHNFETAKSVFSKKPTKKMPTKIATFANGSEEKKDTVMSSSDTFNATGSILSPTQLREKLDRNVIPKTLVIESFEGNDTHLAAVARTICDDESTINSVVTVLFNQLKNWNTDQLCAYLTRPISSHDHHCIISLAVMNPNKFLSVLFDKIQYSPSVDFKAHDVINKLAGYRVPQGKDKGESLYTLAIKYGDFTLHYNKLISVYNRHFPSARALEGAGTQRNPLFVTATDCMGRTPLEIARGAFFETVIEFGYHSRQANMTFDMIFTFTKGKTKESLWKNLKAECVKRGILVSTKKSSKSVTSSKQTTEEKSTASKNSKKRKRASDLAEAKQSPAAIKVVVEKGKNEAKATSTDIDGFVLIESDNPELVKTNADIRPLKVARTTAASSPIATDAAVAATAIDSPIAAVNATKKSEDVMTDETPAFPAAVLTSTTAKTITALAATASQLASASACSSHSSVSSPSKEKAAATKQLSSASVAIPSYQFPDNPRPYVKKPFPTFHLLSQSYNAVLNQRKTNVVANKENGGKEHKF